MTRSQWQSSSIMRHCLWSVVPAVAVTVCYLNSLEGDFVHDDIFAIHDNQDVFPTTPIWNLFFHDFWGEAMSSVTSHKSYRPLTVLTFRLNFMLSGLNSWSYHFFNILLHWMVTVLFGWFCRHEVFEESAPYLKSWIAMLLFATHPVHTEAVSGIVGRADILACIFFLFSLISYFSSTRTLSRTAMLIKLLLSLMSGSAAMLCKEHGSTVLGVCLAYEVMVANSNTVMRLFRGKTRLIDHTHLLIRGSILVLWTAALLWLRISLLHGHLPHFSSHDNPASFSDDHMTKFLTYTYLAYFNLRLLLNPSTLCYDWQMGSIPLITSLIDGRNILTLISFIIIAVLSWSSLRRCGRKGHAPLLGLLLLVVPFLPASNLLIRVGFVVAERILYISSMGWCILVAAGIGYLHQHRPSLFPLLSCLVVLLLTLFSARTIIRNPVWATRHSLFRSALSTVPNNAKVHFNYANYLKDSGRGQEAIPFYQTATRLSPDHAVSHNNLGTLLNGKEAEFHFREAVRHNPHHYKAYYNLGRNLESQGRQVDAEAAYKQSLIVCPTYVDSLMSLASLLAEDGRYDEGWALMERASQEAPLNPDVHNNKGAYLLRTERFHEALSSYQEAIQLDANHVPALTSLAKVYRHLGDIEGAEETFRRSLLVKADLSTYLSYGSMLHNTGQGYRAIDVFRQGLIIHPNRTDLICALVQSLLQEKHLHEVGVILEDGLLNDPLSGCLHLGMGSLKLSLGHLNQAIQYLSRAAELSSESEVKGDALHMMGGALKDLGQLHEAEEAYHAALDVVPSRAVTRMNLGAILHMQKDYSRALVEYELALQLDPNNSILKENLQKLERAARASP